MRILVAAVIGLAACLSAPEAWACSCKRPTPSFLQVARTAGAVVVADVTRHIEARPGNGEMGFEVRVVEVVKGRETRQVIPLVRFGIGMCDVNPANLAIGDRYAIALRAGDSNDGAFSHCRPRIERIVEATHPGSGLTIEELREGLRR